MYCSDSGAIGVIFFARKRWDSRMLTRTNFRKEGALRESPRADTVTASRRETRVVQRAITT